MTNAKKIKRAAISHPENLVFYDNGEIYELLDDPHPLTASVRSELAAELAIRYWLRPTAELSRRLEPYLRLETQKDFLARMAIRQPDNAIASPLFPTSEPMEQRIEPRLRRRLTPLFGTAFGFIPVIAQNQGRAIPFVLADADVAPERRVVDRTGAPIPEWSRSAEALNLPHVQIRVQIHLDTVPTSGCEGNSLQFPVQMAYWRKTNQLPSYNPFAVFATGKIENGCLAAVNARRKYEFIKERFPVAVFFQPVCPDEREQNDDCLVTIPEGTGLDPVLECCREKIERSPNCLIDLSYITNSLARISTMVRQDMLTAWTNIIDRLEKYLDIADKDLEPKTYLNCLIAQSFACCHAGRTKQARRLNAQAADCAGELGLEYELLLLQIGLLVLLQDEENIPAVLELLPTIEGRINALNSGQPGKTDLLMRYHGTVGQAMMFGNVCGMSTFDPAEAKTHLCTAIQYAGQIGDPFEIARDLNYRHLWYALFEPGTKDELNNYSRAYDYSRQYIQSEEKKRVNLNFLYRQRGLAVYRSLLSGREPLEPDWPELFYEAEQVWQRPLCGKYRGALLAHQGDRDQAQRYFADAYSALENMTSPLLRYLCVTIASEACRSMLNLNEPELAARYQQAGLALFATTPEFNQYPSRAAWQAYLTAPEVAPFPGLKYYY